MDLCYILGANKHYEELRFSLRSAVQNLRFDKVYVVGEKPDWLTNVYHYSNIPTGCKASKIRQNIEIIAKNPEVSEDFIFVNDDYFFLKPMEPGYWHKGTLREGMEKVQTGDYYRHLLATEMALMKRGLPRKHFDVHYPMVYNKKKLLEVIDSYSWDIPDGYVLKSLYCNTLGIEGEYREDCKAYGNERWEKWTEGKDMFSISDNNWNRNLHEFLLNLYPEPSIFEK